MATTDDQAAPEAAPAAPESPSPPAPLAGRQVRHRDLLISLALIAAALALSLPRISSPDRYFFDEILHAYTAGRYLDGEASSYAWDHPCSVGKSDRGCVAANPAAEQGQRVGKYEWTHPPLGKLVTAAGILVFGDRPLGWRIGSALAGAIGVALTYRLGVRLTGRRAIALLAAILLLADGLWFVESRLGVPDILVATCLLGALLACAAYLSVPPAAGRRPLLALGLCLGLALATKWNAAYLAALLGLVVVARLLPRGRVPATSAAPGRRLSVPLADLGWVVLALVLLPAAIYLLAHTTFFLAGYDLGDFVELQRQRWIYHRDYDADLNHTSRWWTWPLALHPAFYGATRYGGGEIARVYANVNPLLAWVFLPALLWLCYRALAGRRRHEGVGGRSAPLLPLVPFAFVGQWLPWAFITRPSFIYHFLPVVPLGCLAVAFALGDLWRTGPGVRRTLAGEYVLLVFLAFAYFYPLYAFVPLSDHSFELRLWLPTWR